MNILWIFDMPLRPEAGGTERVTSLVQKGLRAVGHTCYNILVIKADEGKCFYEGDDVKDIYAFLKEKQVDIVVNQYALSAKVLNFFLAHGGDLWHKEGGKIITCLHFNPEPVDNLYSLRVVMKPSLRKAVNIVKAVVLHSFYKKKQDKQAGSLYRELYNKSDAFLLLAESHKDYMSKVLQLDDLSKMYVVANPLTFDTFADETVLAAKKNIVLIVSRIDEYYKRFSLLLRIWKELFEEGKTRDWELKIVGTGNEMQRYRDFVRANRISNISFEGLQNPLPYYQEAKIFMMTSISEGLPMTILESFQQGVVPIVMDSCPIFSELIVNGHNGVLSPEGDIRAYKRGLIELMTNEKYRVTIAREALKSSYPYRLEHIIAEWESLFSKISN